MGDCIDLIYIGETVGEPEAVADAKEHGYVASKNSDVFHVRSCQWAQRIAEGNKVYFGTYQEALDSGRRQCKVCKPKESKGAPE